MSLDRGFMPIVPLLALKPCPDEIFCALHYDGVTLSA